MRIFFEPAMRTYITIWLGQVASLLGSSLSGFALGVYVYTLTGSTTDFALISLFAVLPRVLVAPVAGVIVDRYDRRKVMIAGDAVAGLSTAVLALLYLTGSLQLWHIYLGAFITATGSAFQSPAYIAATTLLVPKQYYSRVSGLAYLGNAVADMLGPALAGILVGVIGLGGVMLIDFSTCIIAVSTLLLVRFPALPQQEMTEKKPAESIWKSIRAGLDYLSARRGLLALVIYFSSLNFASSFTYILITPMVLSFSNEGSLGMIISGLGVGLLIGSLLMSTWGGPKRHVKSIFGFGILYAITTIFTGFQNIPLILGASIAVGVGSPIVNGAARTLLQTKVEPQMQGRVFSILTMLSMSSMPLAYILAGPLADNVFNPLLMPKGALADSVGQIIGVGAGRGIGFFIILLGVMSLVGTGIAYLYRPLRTIQESIPDVELPKTETTEVIPELQTA